MARPSKGPRKELSVRLPVPLAEAASREAARRGMTINDYVGELIAGEIGVPYSTQEALKTA